MNFYDSIIEGAQELPASERGQLYAAALEYLYYGREPDFKMRPAPRAVYLACKPNFDRQREGATNGRKGGRPPKQKTQTKPPLSENQNQNETTPFENEKPPLSENGDFSESEQEQEQELEKESLRDSKKTRPRFEPPTAEEVDAYLTERGLADYLTGTQFVGYYGSQGWRKANGQPVTNWKLAACGWAERERRRNPKGGADDGFDDFAI